VRRLLALVVVVGFLPTISDAEERRGRGHVTRLESPAGYFQIVRAWHTATPGKLAPLDQSGRPQLVLHAMYVDETVILPAATDMGGFLPCDLARATHALREPSSGNEQAIEPRTVDVLYRIQRRFGAQEIRVMSAYRTPKKGNSQGLHAMGRAVDFVVPGAADEDVARYARQMGFVGVGVYPLGGFVHVDVRVHSYFWRDASGPKHRSRERGILGELARSSDDAAIARGEAPPVADLTRGSNEDEDE
jgi:uncharacterized protein YcbK (DUF882 family)